MTTESARPNGDDPPHVDTATMRAADQCLGFSYAAFESLVRDFAETVPALLLQHRETADLAFAVERLGLVDSLRTRFTVAIIGQMRAGKSTLLNALMGCRLAPTGVNETTATVNWFRHGEGEQCQRFRVHWNDGSSEDHPLSAIDAWLGRSEQAQHTQALDFFADTPFLRLANLVDTPGTRSVLDTHEQTVQGFLAERLETETLRQGGRADAIIYAINPVARQDDRELLALFEERSRLPGASAYNSIAVMQKWEHLDDDGDPLAAARRKCARLRDQLQGKVAEVIPVSGMLALLAAEQPPSVWDQIAHLAVTSSAETLEDLLLSDAYFCDDHPQAALDSAARRALLQAVTWPALRFCLGLAQREHIDSGATLVRRVRETSGIDRLQQVLQTRFFALSGLIKAGTVLRKAWQPCDQALLLLRDLTEQRRMERQQADQAAQLLRGLITGTPALAQVLDYVSASTAAVDNEQRRAEATWDRLEQIRSRAEQGFRFLDADLACLEQLERLPADSLDAERRDELRRLFGGDGPGLYQRLGVTAETPLDASLETQVWDRRDAWAAQRAQSAHSLAPLFDHAVDCLDRVLEEIEAEIEVEIEAQPEQQAHD